MRYPVILAGSMLAGIVSALPVAAQTAPPLAYVQPVAPQVVQDVQNRLRQAGAYNGQIDGIWGADSQAALERYQQSHQLQVTGQLNQATAATLGLDQGSLLTVPTAAPAPPPLPGDQLRSASVQAIQASTALAWLLQRRGRRRLGRRHPGGDRTLPARSRSAAERTAQSGNGRRDGPGAGRAGLPVGLSASASAVPATSLQHTVTPPVNALLG